MIVYLCLALSLCVAEANAYATVMQNYQCQKPVLFAGKALMGGKAVVDDERQILLKRASDGAVLSCDGTATYAAGDTFIVSLSPPKPPAQYAEHLFELQEAPDGARFSRGGCNNKRTAGQWIADSQDNPPIALVTPRVNGDLRISAGWQTGHSPVRLTRTCVLREKVDPRHDSEL